METIEMRGVAVPFLASDASQPEYQWQAQRSYARAVRRMSVVVEMGDVALDGELHCRD